MTRHILVIDQGTTSTRAIVFERGARRSRSRSGNLRSLSAAGLGRARPGRDLAHTLATAREALASRADGRPTSPALGITNQRETTWSGTARTGRPIHNAIVWQDRRTAAACERLEREPATSALVASAPACCSIPYFSATKIAWLLDNVAGARAAAERGELAFGTVDSFLLWRLTGGAASCDRRHQRLAHAAVRHPSPANGTTICWRCSTFPRAMLPEVRDSAADFGAPRREHFGAPIADPRHRRRPAGGADRSGLFRPGMVKSTYGTGCFILLQHRREARSPDAPAAHHHRLHAGVRTYALEGSIFVAGAAVQWLRDGLGLIASAAETGALAAARRPDAARLSGARVHRPRRAALGQRGARRC